jgi:hypothetical protein
MGSTLLLIALSSVWLSGAMPQEAVDSVARAVVPILKDARASAQKVTIEPGTLPPSPITGRNSTLIAIKIGKRSMHLDQKVVDVIDRLLAWDVRQPVPAADRQVVTDWVEEMRVGVMGRLAQRQKSVGCDNACLVEHLTKPGPIFGTSREDQVEARNDLLLTALADVVQY